MDADPTKSNEPDFNWDELIRELSDPACSKHAASFCRRYILGKLIAKHGLDIRSLGNRMDASDIASSVMGNFLRVSPVYADKPGDEVRKILLTIIRNKTTDKIRANLADTRDVRRESLVEDFLLEAGKRPSSQSNSRRQIKSDDQPKIDTEIPALQSEDFQGLVDQFLTPDCFEMFHDFKNKLPEQLHEVLQLVVQGFTSDEIGEQLQYSKRTVLRKLALVRDYLGDWS